VGAASGAQEKLFKVRSTSSSMLCACYYASRAGVWESFVGRLFGSIWRWDQSRSVLIGSPHSTSRLCADRGGQTIPPLAPPGRPSSHGRSLLVQPSAGEPLRRARRDATTDAEPGSAEAVSASGTSLILARKRTTEAGRGRPPSAGARSPDRSAKGRPAVEGVERR
jgi:hypothetical protein